MAADLYELFIQQTFELCANSSADDLCVAFEPAQLRDAFKGIIPTKFHRFPQSGLELGHRLHNAFEYVFSKGAERVIVIGSDSPTLPGNYLDEAMGRLDSVDLVLGPADDGGYYLIGTKQSHKALFENIQWSSDSVLQSTIERAKQMKISYHLLPNWYDVDDLASLERAAEDDTSGKISGYLLQHPEISLH